MALFRRFEKAGKAKTEARENAGVAGAAAGWDSLASTPFAGENTSVLMTGTYGNTYGGGYNDEITERMSPYPRNERQERKMMSALLFTRQEQDNPNFSSKWYEAGLAQMISAHDAPEHPRDREKLSQYFIMGAVDDRTASGIISKIRPNAAMTPEQTMGSLAARERNILGYFTSFKWGDNWQNASTRDLDSFYAQFPTPIEFESEEATFLDKIEDLNGAAKRAAYEDAMENFKKHVFGKRYEYYKSYQNLKAEAFDEVARADQYQSQSGITERLDKIPVPRATATPEYQKVPETAEVRQLDKRESERVLRDGRIMGDTYKAYDGREYRLTKEALSDYGLAPEYQVGLAGVNVNLSKIFSVDGRPAAIAYVETAKGTQVCSYYRSSSQGVWRLLPDYTPDAKTGYGLGWYGKGRSEESLTLPAELQTALETVNAAAPHIDLDQVSSEFAFCGTAMRYGSTDEYLDKMRRGEMRGSYWEEVADRPLKQYGDLAFGDKDEPSRLNVPSGEAPDFSRSFLNYRSKSAVFGNFTVKHFQSKDRRLRYTFNSDDAGRAWIGGIEAVSQFTSTGLRRDWVKAGDLATPIYEYQSMVEGSGYGDEGDYRGGYIGMWKSYVSKIPLVREFLASEQRNRRS